jgi:transcription termination factor Rho
MAEAKSRPNNPRPRPRPRPDAPMGNGNEGAADDLEPEAQATAAPASAAEAPRPPKPSNAEDDYIGFDEEVNNRYEEIKRGGTHISELQQMTMPQLMKTAKDEGLTEVTGLKKQDLIFKILRSGSSRTA